MSRPETPMRQPRKNSHALKVSHAFRQFVLDQLQEAGEIIPRAMFGGVGLYARGHFFGIIAGDVLYLRVDETTRPAYERYGMAPFKPYPNRSVTMKYYAVPLVVLESQEELAKWARQSIRVAERAASSHR
jgi:DNA transformation protein